MTSDPAERAAERIATALFVSDPGIKQVLADTIRSEYGESELMACGHPRACWHKSRYALGPDADEEIKAAFNGSYCTACKREAELIAPLKKELDRAWKDETPRQVVAIAANALYWRQQVAGSSSAEVERLQGREAAAVEAAREACAVVADLHANSGMEERAALVSACIAKSIRALNLTSALDRAVNEARIKEATWWEANLAKEVHDAHCANQDGDECICCKRIAELKATRSTSSANFENEAMAATAVGNYASDAQRALDRAVNEARLEEAERHRPHPDYFIRQWEHRIAELKAALAVSK